MDSNKACSSNQICKDSVGNKPLEGSHKVKRLAMYSLVLVSNKCFKVDKTLEDNLNSLVDWGSNKYLLEDNLTLTRSNNGHNNKEQFGRLVHLVLRLVPDSKDSNGEDRLPEHNLELLNSLDSVHNNDKVDSVHSSNKVDSVQHHNSKVDSVHSSNKKDSVQHHNSRVDSVQHHNSRVDSVQHHNSRVDSVQHHNSKVDSVRNNDKVDLVRNSSKEGSAQHHNKVDLVHSSNGLVPPHNLSKLDLVLPSSLRVDFNKVDSVDNSSSLNKLDLVQLLLVLVVCHSKVERSVDSRLNLSGTLRQHLLNRVNLELVSIQPLLLQGVQDGALVWPLLAHSLSLAHSQPLALDGAMISTSLLL